MLTVDYRDLWRASPSPLEHPCAIRWCPHEENSHSMICCPPIPATVWRPTSDSSRVQEAHDQLFSHTHTHTHTHARTHTHTVVRQILKRSYGLVSTSNQLIMLLWNEAKGDVKTVPCYIKHTVSILSAQLSDTVDDGCIINNTGDSTKQYYFHNT